MGGIWLAHEIHKTHEITQNTQYHRVHITWEVHGWPHLAADPAPVKPQLFRPTHSHFSMTIQIQIQTHSWKREVKSPKKNSLCFLLLAWPWIFLSNQIDLDNSGWNSSRYRNVSFLVALDQRILWRNQESCWTSSLVLFRSSWVALSALWSKLDPIQRCISRNFPPRLSKSGKRGYFGFLCWLIH